MKSLLILLTINLFLAGAAQSQTRPVTKSASKPASKTTTKPTSRTTVGPARSPGQPSVSGTTSTSATPNRQQELYDRYHSVTQKPASPTTNPPVTKSATTTSVAKSAPIPIQPAQADGTPSRVRIGIRGGVSYLVLLEDEFNSEPKVSFVGGIVANFGQGRLSFQPEFNYARYASTVTEPFLNTTNALAVDRFEVPLFLKISSGSANSTRLFLNVGPYGAYTSSSSINGQKVSLDGVTNRFSFGAAAGIGAAVKAGPGHLTIEVRGLYYLGDTETGFNTDSRIINTQATVGYLIPLGGR